MNWEEFIPFDYESFRASYPEFLAVPEIALRDMYNNEVLVAYPAPLISAYDIVATIEKKKKVCGYISNLMLAALSYSYLNPTQMGQVTFGAGKDVKTAISACKKLGLGGIYQLNAYWLRVYQYMTAKNIKNPLPTIQPSYTY